MNSHTIQCWSCGTQKTLGEIRDADGYCPECAAEIDLAEYYPKLASDYAALEAKCANLENSLLAITARHFAESWKKRTSDAELEQYLSAGIAQLEAERDTLRQQRDKLAGVLLEKFPRIDPHTPVPLNELDHCCEYVLYQERERLHKVIDAALSELTP